MENSPEIEIDLGTLLLSLWQKKWTILAVSLICAILALLGTLTLIKPKYQSSFVAYVNNHSSQQSVDSLNSGDTTAAKSLAATYAAIMRSRSVLENAVELAGYGNDENYVYDVLKNEVSTSVETDTQLVTLTVETTDPEVSYKLADAISQVAPEHVEEIVEGSSMKLVSSAVMPVSPSSPNVKKNTAIGFLLGLLLIAAIIIIRDLNDDRITGPDELEQRFGISIVGTIPNFSASGRGEGYYYSYGGKKGKQA